MKTAIALLTIAMLLTGCGGGSKSSTTNGGGNSQPLDPQGNWLFVLTGSTGQVELQFAGQLFELVPPVVTANEMGTAPFGYTCGGMTPSGQASGTDSIALTVAQTDRSGAVPFALTGTIAEDEAHMSGTWTAANNGCTPSQSGTWAAQLLTPVTGTWTGTADNGAVLSATLTENTDQTSPNMGTVTGTLTITNTACFSGPLAVSSAFGHLGESLFIETGADADGASVSNLFSPGSVDTAATHSTGMKFTVHGGQCDGQTFTADLGRQ